METLHLLLMLLVEHGSEIDDQNETLGHIKEKHRLTISFMYKI